MDLESISNSSNNINLDNYPNAGVTAKIRRLKIQEELLIQSVKKNILSASGGDNNFIKADLEFKKFVSKLYKDNANIKHLFEDVKCTTKSQDILKTLEIDDIKKDVLELEEKIKSFKIFLQGELTELKKSEKEILKQFHTDNESYKMKKKYTKITKKTFSDIVPSPVKNIINSPFKCPEVQQFQDFISTTNRTGGWSEYNHNTFVRILKKHFQNYEYFFDIEKINCIEKEACIDEILVNIKDVKRNDIISHMNWFAKYLHLKKRQQLALDRWRSKTKPKKVLPTSFEVSHENDARSLSAYDNKRKKLKKHKRGQSFRKSRYCSEDVVGYSSKADKEIMGKHDANVIFKEVDYLNNSSNSDDDLLTQYRFSKPTKQWKSRCNSAKDFQTFNSNVEDISKLGIPSWRLGFSNTIV